MIYFRLIEIMNSLPVLLSEAGNTIQYLRGRRRNNTVVRFSLISSSFGIRINSLSEFSLNESLKYINPPVFRPRLLAPRPPGFFNSERKLSYYQVKMNRTFVYLTLASLCFAFVNSGKSEKVLKFYQEKNFHEAQDLTDEEVREIANLSDMQHFRNTLDQILIPRVVGTPNHEKVGNFIVNEMRGLGWGVTENVFTDQTPVFGTLNFKNIIAKLNPKADRYLVLACHYDSKYTREHVFMGATDSAVPCAMLLNLAKVMSSKLEPLKNNKLSLMFIFFDGEEAFRQWGPKDSIYGARHLAKKWQETSYKDGANHLQRMDVLVLLDLLGAPDPVFYSYFQSTEKWYVRLAAAEQKLAELNTLQNYSKGKSEQKYFRLRSSGATIEDDHIPFLRRNVDILHVIPSPFPSIWHTAGDDITALDFGTIENLNKIFRVFVSEYLHC